MALPASPNQISMKDILDEKQGATTARTNVSLKGLSVDGTNDYDSVDISGTPNGTAPYAMSEFHGYSQFSWGTPNNTVGGGTPFNQNFAAQFDGTVYALNAGQRDIATSCYIRLESSFSSGPRVSFFLHRTGDGVTTTSTSQGQVSYNGTLSKIEVRFVYYKVDIDASENGGVGVVGEAYSNSATSNSQLVATDVTSNSVSVTGANTIKLLATTDTASSSASPDRQGNDQTFNGDWIDFGADNNVQKTAMIFCSADGDSGEPGAQASIGSGGDGTISLQLRANQDNNSIVTLFTKSAGSWEMEADSEDDDTS